MFWTYEQLMKLYRTMGYNLITPTRLDLRVLVERGTVVELSSGEGFDRETVWGVTVFNFANPKAPKSPHHGLYHTIREARAAFEAA